MLAMNAILESADSMRWLAVLLDVTVKGLLIIAAAAGASLLLRRRSAAVRHLVWAMAAASLLCLPVLSVALPKLQAPILPVWAADVVEGKPAIPEPAESQPEAPLEDIGRNLTAAPVETPTDSGFDPLPSPAEPHVPEPVEPVERMEEASSEMPSAAAVEDPTPAQTPAPLHWSAWILLAWVVGVAVIAFPLLIGTVTVFWKARRAKRITGGPWASLLKELRGKLGINRPVTLLQSDSSAIPATWGSWRPVILLPAEADGWCDQRRRIVLLHELTHVKRRDCLTQLVGQLACTLYWFNPLVWLAARMLRIEREQACDDLVLNAGLKPSDYAGHLLEIVRSLRSARCPSLAAVAMAQKSQFEHRLLAILDAKRNRRALTRWEAIAAIVAIAALAIPIACLKPTRAADFADATVSLRMDLESGRSSPKLQAVLKVSDREQLQQLLSFFPQLKKKSNIAAGWESGVVVELSKHDGSKVRVSVSVNDGLQTWSAGKGDWPVKGNLKAFLLKLKQSQASTQLATQPEKPATGKFLATLPNGVTVELVALWKGINKDDRQWWRPDGTVMSKTQYAPYERKSTFRILESKNSKFKFGYVYRFTPTNKVSTQSNVGIIITPNPSTPVKLAQTAADNAERLIRDVIKQIRSGSSFFDEDGFVLVAVSSATEHERKMISAGTGDIKIAAAHGPWQRTTTSGGTGHSGRFKINGIHTLKDASSMIIISGPRPGKFGPNEELMIDATVNADDVEISLLYELKTGEIRKAKLAGTRGGTLLESSYQKEKTMIQHRFRVPAKVDRFRQIIVEYRKYQCATFKNVSLKPGQKTNVQIQTYSKKPPATKPGDKAEGAAWSKAVNGLQARIILKRSEVLNGTPIISTYLHLRNVSGNATPMRLAWAREKMKFRVIDADGRELSANMGSGNWRSLGTQDLVIPNNGTLSFDISSRGLGIPGDQAGLIDLGPTNNWVFKHERKDYSLRAILKIPEDKHDRDGRSWWHGKIEMPPVKVPLKLEPVDPAKLGERIRQLGGKMLGTDFAASEKAVRALSLIDDARVIPWYLKAMDTNRYGLKFAAMDRLRRFNSDEAFRGLKKGITTRGADIGYCTTDAVADQMADNIRHAAAGALSRSPHPQAGKLLLSLWNDPSRAVRITVLHALGRMDSAESLNLLKKMSKNPDKDVREEALRYLKLREARPATKPAAARDVNIIKNIELIDKDGQQPGLYCGVPLYSTSDWPGAGRIYKLAKTAHLRGVDYRHLMPELVARLSGVYSARGSLEIAQQILQDKTITIRLRYIDEEKDISSSPMVWIDNRNKNPKSVYLWGELPKNLPQGKYTVKVELDEYIRKGNRLVPAPKTRIRHFERLTCSFTVPASTTQLTTKPVGKADRPHPEIWRKYPHLKEKLDAGLGRMKTYLTSLEPEAFAARHPDLAKMAQGDDPTQRARAIKAISALRDKSSLPIVVAAVEKEKTPRRGPRGNLIRGIQCLNSLTKWVYGAYHPDRKVPRELAPLLPLFVKMLVETGDKPNVRAYCFQAIGCLAGPEWLPLVKDLSASRHPAVTHWSGWALKEITKQTRHPATHTGKSQPAAPGKEEVLVMGTVPRPGVYSLSQNRTVRRLLLSAGFKPGHKNLERVYLRRRGGDGERIEWLVNIQSIIDGSAKDIPLQAGNLLFTEDIRETVERHRATKTPATQPATQPAKRKTVILEAILKQAAVSTRYRNLDIFEQTPGVPGEYRIRAGVVRIPLRFGWGVLDPAGEIFYLPDKNIYYIQYDRIGSSTLHYYGPFKGNPKEFNFQPATQPAGLGKAWGRTVNGLRARIEAGRYLTKRLGMEVSVYVQNVGKTPVMIDLGKIAFMDWRVLDAEKRVVRPGRERLINSKSNWRSVIPDQEIGLTISSSKRSRNGVLDMGTRTWNLKPGKYTLKCDLVVNPDIKRLKPAAWSGRIELPSVAFEVIAEVSDERLKASVAKVRAAHPAKGEKMWRALANLVNPGMTVRQMKIALPHARPVPGVIPDGGTIYISGPFFTTRYALDGQFGVEASGVGENPMVLTSRPRVKRIDQLPLPRIILPTTQPAT